MIASIPRDARLIIFRSLADAGYPVSSESMVGEDTVIIHPPIGVDEGKIMAIIEAGVLSYNLTNGVDKAELSDYSKQLDSAIDSASSIEDLKKIIKTIARMSLYQVKKNMG